MASFEPFGLGLVMFPFPDFPLPFLREAGNAEMASCRCMTVLAAFSRLKLPASGNLPMLSPHILPFFSIVD